MTTAEHSGQQNQSVSNMLGYYVCMYGYIIFLFFFEKPQHFFSEILHTAHRKNTRRLQRPFSHLLITHSYLCSVLFTRSLKQVLMRTKGIRQAEDESPYTVKTRGAAWWKEEDSHSLTLSSWKQANSSVKSIITV